MDNQGQAMQVPIPIMAKNIIPIRIFVASPSDVQKERDVLEKAVQAINRQQDRPPQLWLRLLRWEKDVYPDRERPQAGVNQQIGDHDIFVGIMWKRFGAPAGIAASVTEEECKRAYERYQRQRVPALHFFFRAGSEQLPATPEEVDQFRKITEFRRRVAKSGIVGLYANADEFGKQVRRFLDKKVKERLNQPSGGSGTKHGTSNGATVTPSASPQFTAIPMPESRPSLTDRDRRRFLQEGFDGIRTYVQQALQTLKSQHEIVDIVVQEDTAQALVFEIFLQGQSKNRCRIWIADRLGAHTIAYTEGHGADSLAGHAIHDCASVTENAGQPVFALSGMDIFSSVKPGQKVNSEGLAEYLWRRATRPLAV